MGNGKSINIGVDPIAGLKLDYVLLVELRSYLEDYGITTLVDAHNWESGPFAH